MLPNNKNTFKSLLGDLQSLVQVRHTPSDVVNTILAQWMSKITPGITRPSQKRDLSKNGSVVAFAGWLGSTDILTGAFWLSSVYAALLDKEQRKASAMYFTPPYLSNRILDNAGSHLLSGKIIDPACGGAAFLAPAAQRIANHLASNGKRSKAILSHIEKHLFGLETDPFLCKLSTTFLRMVLAEHIEATGLEPKFNVHCGDGLSALPDTVGTFDLVLSNPPYRKMTREEIEPLIDAYGSIVVGQPNLYSLFIKRASELVKPGGKSILLTPMSFLSGKSFSKLRLAMVNSGHINRLDLIHDKTGVFLWAEQDAVVTVWVKHKEQKAADIYCLSLDGAAKFTGHLIIRNSGAPWPIPRQTQDAELLGLFTNLKYTLQTYGYQAKTGAIVIHRDKRNRYDSATAGKKAKQLVPLIWQRDIGTDGVLHFGEDLAAAERFIDMATLGTPSIVKRPAVAMQRVTSSNQTRRLICAPIPEILRSRFGGVAGENHVCLIEQVSDNTAVTPELLSEILRTETVDRLFRCISGATNVSSYELLHLPLPDPELVIQALTKGHSIDEATRLGLGLSLIRRKNNVGGSNNAQAKLAVAA